MHCTVPGLPYVPGVCPRHYIFPLVLLTVYPIICNPYAHRAPYGAESAAGASSYDRTGECCARCTSNDESSFIYLLVVFPSPCFIMTRNKFGIFHSLLTVGPARTYAMAGKNMILYAFRVRKVQATRSRSCLSEHVNCDAQCPRTCPLYYATTPRALSIQRGMGGPAAPVVCRESTSNPPSLCIQLFTL
jgi:hypothetical protein